MPSAKLQEPQWQRLLSELRAIPGVYVGQEDSVPPIYRSGAVDE